MQTTEENKSRLSCSCPVCHAQASFLDSVNFNKSCEEVRGLFLPASEKWIDYYLCDQCGFCFVPEMYRWSFDDFGRHIYNQNYEQVDPDYKSVRPQGNAQLIDQFFGSSKATLRHLDYGGGSGLLSTVLRDKGWDSTTYDPFVNADLKVADLGCYDLVTAFEVFEHVTDIDGLLRNLYTLCKPDGLVLFSTLLSDGEIAPGKKVTWWYAGPRNGHISLFSAKSLHVCMQRSGLQVASFSANLHMAFRQLPQWASHLMKQPEPAAPQSTTVLTLQEGIALHVDGQFAQAQAVYEALLAAEPDHYDALHLMGVLAMQTDDFERAVDLIGKAIAIHPDNFGFYINHGNALNKLMRFDSALVSFDKGIALNPDLPDLHWMRGNVLQALQQLDTAIASFDKAIALKSDYAVAHESRLQALQAREQKGN